ncbi:MAG: hypothetical protein MZV64_71835 [Ignavibacteriales bacterium]|nr:hypothetical protein [Ignavibacteriales bacterium]
MLAFLNDGDIASGKNLGYQGGFGEQEPLRAAGRPDGDRSRRASSAARWPGR